MRFCGKIQYIKMHFLFGFREFGAVSICHLRDFARDHCARYSENAGRRTIALSRARLLAGGGDFLSIDLLPG